MSSHPHVTLSNGSISYRVKTFALSLVQGGLFLLLLCYSLQGWTRIMSKAQKRAFSEFSTHWPEKKSCPLIDTLLMLIPFRIWTKWFIEKQARGHCKMYLLLIIYDLTRSREGSKCRKLSFIIFFNKIFWRRARDQLLL